MTDASKTVGIEPPHDMALPKITPEIWEAYQDEEFIEDSPRWNWTQAAVDFACEIVRPAVRAEIERLTRGNEILRDELVKIDALHDSVEAERDRLRAALERMSKWKGHAGDVARKALSGEPGSAVETTGKPPHCVNCHCEEAAKGMVDRSDYLDFHRGLMAVVYESKTHAEAVLFAERALRHDEQRSEKATGKCPHDRPLGTPCPRCDL